MITQTISQNVQMKDELAIPIDDVLTKLIQLHSDQCAEFIRETPNDYLGRVRILRRVTVGLFATSLLLSVVLNATFVILHSTFQEMLIGNAPVLLLFILSAISFLNDRSLQPFREDAMIGQVRQRLELVLSQIHDLQKLKSAMTRGNERLLNHQHALELQLSEKEVQLQQLNAAHDQVSVQLDEATFNVASKQSEWDSLSLRCQTREAESSSVLAQVHEDIAAAKAELVACNEQLSKSKSELHATEITRRDQEQAVTQLAIELRLSRQELDNIHSQRASEEERFISTQAEQKLAMESLAESRVTIDWLKSELENFQVQLSIAKTDLSAAAKEKAQLEAEAGQLEAKIEDQKIELMHLQHEEIRIKTDVERLEFSRQEIAHQLQDIQFEIDCDRQKLNAVRYELSQAIKLQNQYLYDQSFHAGPKEADPELDVGTASKIQLELLSQLLWLQNEIRLLRAEQLLLNGHVQELENLRSQKESVHSKLLDTQARLTDLQQDVVRVEDDRSQLLAQRDQLSANSQSLKSCIDEMRDLIDSLRMESSQLSDMLSNQRNDLDLANVELASVQQQCRDLELNNASATSSLEAILDSIEKMHCRELELQDTISNLQVQYEQACETNQATERRAQLIQTSINELSGDRQQLEKEITSLKMQKRMLMEGIEDLELEKTKLAMTNEELKMNLMEKHDQLQSAEASLRNAEQSLQSTLNSIIEKENLLATIQEEYAILQRESKHLQAQIEQHRSAFQQISTNILERKQEHERLVYSNEEVNVLVRELTAQSKALEAKIQDSIHEKQSVDESIEIKRQQLKELQAQAEALESVSFELNLQQQRLREAQAEVKRTENILDEQQLKSQALNEEVYTATAAKSGLQRDCEELEATLTALKVNVEAMKLDDANLQKAIQSSQVKLAELQKNVESWSDEASRRQSERGELLSELESISKDVAESQKVCEQWQAYKLKLQKENEELKQSKLDAQHAIKLASDDHCRMKNDCRLLQDQHAQLQKENRDLQTAIEDAHQKLRGVQLQEADLRTTVQRLEQDLKQLSSDMKQSTQEVHREQEKLLLARQESNRLESQLDATQQSIVVLNSEIDALEDQRDSLREESDRVARALLDLNQNCEEAQIKLADSEHARSQLASEIQDMERRSKSLASLLKDRQAQCDAADSDLLRIQDCIAGVMSTQQELVQERDRLKKVVESYQKTSHELTSQIANCESEYEAKRLQLAKLSSEEAKLKESIRDQQEKSNGLEQMLCTKQDELRLLDSHFNATIAEQSSKLENAQGEIESTQRSLQLLVAEYQSLQNLMSQALKDREAFVSDVDAVLCHTEQSMAELLQRMRSQFNELEQRSTSIQDSQAALLLTVKEKELAQAELKKLLGEKEELATEVDALLIELRSIHEEVELALQKRDAKISDSIIQINNAESDESIKESIQGIPVDTSHNEELVANNGRSAVEINLSIVASSDADDTMLDSFSGEQKLTIDAWSIAEVASTPILPSRVDVTSQIGSEAREKDDLWSTVL